MDVPSFTVLDCNSPPHRASPLKKIASIEMQKRLEAIPIHPQLIAEMGCAHERDTSFLLAQFSDSQIICIDQSSQVLSAIQEEKTYGLLNWIRRLSKKNRVSTLESNLYKIPMHQNSIDLIWSNMSLHHVPLYESLSCFFRLLRPGGLLIFSTLGQRSLEELQRSYLECLLPYQWQLPDIQHFAQMLMHIGYQDTVIDRSLIECQYKNVLGILRDIRYQGFLYPQQQFNFHQIKKLYSHYQNKYPTYNGVKSTLEIIYGHAWKKENLPHIQPIRFSPLVSKKSFAIKSLKPTL